jgi:hypothetical protein
MFLTFLIVVGLVFHRFLFARPRNKLARINLQQFASDDGSIRLWDVMLNVREGDRLLIINLYSDAPFLRIFRSVHGKNTLEVCSVDWSNIKKDMFASSPCGGSSWNCKAGVPQPVDLLSDNLPVASSGRLSWPDPS